MCGITGFIDTSRSTTSEALSASARAMADRMVHRGPDDRGEWADARVGVALAHRRLSIVDLSPEGHQPMASASGRYVVVFNGEIYNYPQLRGELGARGHTFRGHSDTEVLLAAVEELGVAGAVERFNGMFAFALWDARERRLHLVRDRLGEKPLYYGWAGRTFLFASELKALRSHAAMEQGVSRGALALYLRHGYVPAPHSIYEGIQKLPPGHHLTIDPARPGEASPAPYWRVRDAVAAGTSTPFRGGEEAAVEELDALLRDAVRIRMHADVPPGAFLSGGVDSSTVVALMQAQSGRPVRTFTIGFGEKAFNEAENAKRVATLLGTDHTELYLGPGDALEVIPRLPQMFDEPFADSSQVPTFLVSRLARSQVTVSLSGDGGDEVFGGYTRYLLARSLWRYVTVLPRPVRGIAASAIAGAPRVTGALLSAARRLLLRSVEVSSPPADQARRLARLLSWRTPAPFYRDLVSMSPEPGALLQDATEPESALTLAQQAPYRRPLVEQMMAWDLESYLPDDILVKVDRASMAVSLESRVPFLDHRVVEFAWRLPLALKVKGDVGKHVLRNVLYRYVPREVMEGPKRGFAVPVDEWLRGPLREWALDLLSEEHLARHGLFRPAAVSSLVREHLDGRRSWGAQLWALLMFQAWHDDQARHSTPTLAASSTR